MSAVPVIVHEAAPSPEFALSRIVELGVTNLATTPTLLRGIMALGEPTVRARPTRLRGVGMPRLKFIQGEAGAHPGGSLGVARTDGSNGVTGRLKMNDKRNVDKPAVIEEVTFKDGEVKFVYRTTINP